MSRLNPARSFCIGTAQLGVLLLVGSIGISMPGFIDSAKGQPGPPPGRGPQWNDPQFRKDRQTFHFLLSNRESIRRTVTNLENGIETVTESDDPEVAAKIQEHVASMYQRVEKGRPIHRRDPLFAVLFDHADGISMEVEKTEKGVHVVETAEDPYVAKLIQAHANVVSLFVKNGHREVRRNHEVPERDGE